jgi:thiamine kinase-like enzyme
MDGDKTPEISLEESIPNFHLYVEALVEGLTKFGESFQTRQQFNVLKIIPWNWDPTGRFVVKFSHNGNCYAMKSSKTGVGQEFRNLQSASRIFETVDALNVARPIWLSDDKKFYVTLWAKGETGYRLVKYLNSEIPPHQVFKQAGQWLQHLHRSEKIESIPFDSQAMLRTLTDALVVDQMYLPRDIYDAAIYHMTCLAKQVTTVPTPCVLSHGDFNPQNSVFSSEQITVLDFNRMGRKNAAYDIIRFLILDVRQNALGAELNKAGISQTNIDAFFKGYNLEIPPEVLTYSIQAILLYRLIRISKETHHENNSQRKNYDNLLKRVEFILSNTSA